MYIYVYIQVNVYVCGCVFVHVHVDLDVDVSFFADVSVCVNVYASVYIILSLRVLRQFHRLHFVMGQMINVVGSGVTRQVTAVSQSGGTEGDLVSVEESGCRKSKGTDETVAVGGGQCFEMEGDSPM